MLNIDVIRSQKSTPGYVEIPACERLRALAAEATADQAIVEIGAFGGRSTGWLALGASEGHGAHVISVDTWGLRPAGDWPDDAPGYVQRYSEPGIEAAYQAHLDNAGIRDRVTPVKGFSLDVAKTWRKDGRPKIGLLFHDAAHHHDEVADDLKAWLPLMSPDGVVTCHDAGNPRYGVYSAAEQVFSRRTTWDWAGHELQRWPKSPERRGLLIIRRPK